MEDRRTEKLYTRITPEDDEALRIACAKLRISRPDAAEVAIRQWISNPLSLEGKGTLPIGNVDTDPHVGGESTGALGRIETKIDRALEILKHGKGDSDAEGENTFAQANARRTEEMLRLLHQLVKETKSGPSRPSRRRRAS